MMNLTFHPDTLRMENLLLHNQQLDVRVFYGVVFSDCIYKEIIIASIHFIHTCCFTFLARHYYEIRAEDD
jgi:hypothetical protein